MPVLIHDRYKHFAMAIVTTAIKEYRYYLALSKKQPEDDEVLDELGLIEAFFRSPAYRVLSNQAFDGEKLIEEIRRQERI